MIVYTVFRVKYKLLLSAYLSKQTDVYNIYPKNEKFSKLFSQMTKPNYFN